MKNNLNGYYFCVDVGGTEIKAGIVDKNANIISSAKIKTTPNEHNHLETNIIKVFENLSSSTGLNVNDAQGIGIGLPGIVDSKNGVLNFSGNLKLENYPIKKILSKHFKPEIKITNDAEASLLAELHYGAGKNLNNFILITIGTGIGCGIVLNRTSIRNFSPHSCEIGHMKITDKNVKCSCGELGCFEAIASSKALTQFTKTAMKNNPHSKMWKTYNLETASAKTVFDYKDDDETARNVFETFIENLGTGLVNLCNVYMPEAIIVGGAISAQEKALIKPLENYINSHIYEKNAGFKIKCKTAKFKNQSGLLGTSCLFLEDRGKQ